LQGVLLVVTSGTVDEGQIVPLTRDGEILDSHLAGHL